MHRFFSLLIGVCLPFVATGAGVHQLLLNGESDALKQSVGIASLNGTDTGCAVGIGTSAAVGYSTVGNPTPFGAADNYTIPNTSISIVTMVDCTSPNFGGPYAILRIGGFGADPGSGFVRRIICTNGSSFNMSTAVYSYSSGTARWDFGSSEIFNFTDGGSATCDVYHG